MPSKKSPRRRSQKASSPRRISLYSKFLKKYAEDNKPLPNKWLQDAAVEWKMFKEDEISMEKEEKREEKTFNPRKEQFKVKDLFGGSI
jgi:hypothetical protein